VEAAVCGVRVLRRAGGAQGERTHGGGGAVIRKVVDDRGARATVGAVDEGVAVAAVGGVAHLGEAVVAGGEVGREEAVRGCAGLARSAVGPALFDGEAHRGRVPVGRGAGDILEGDRFADQALHPGARWGLGSQASGEGIERLGRPGRLDLHSAGGVAHATGQAEFRGEPPHEGPEAHTLHHALDHESARGLGGWVGVERSDARRLARPLHHAQVSP